LNKEKLNEIKSCCVAIGLTKQNSEEPYEIFGSGFIINSKYWIFSAWHVLDKCQKRFIELNGGRNVEKGIKFVAFYVTQLDTTMQIMTIPLDMIVPLNFRFPEGFIGPYNLDVGVAIPNPDLRLINAKFLEIEESQINLFNEIAVCGFPGGKNTFNEDITEDQGLRTSPIIQFGRISALLPSDKNKNYYGIQTDIIGTSGSSGSPIVDLDTFRVIGMAQDVLDCNINGNFTGSYRSTPKIEGEEIVGRFSGKAKIGLIYGRNMQWYKQLVNAPLDDLTIPIELKIDLNGLVKIKKNY
jgi:hypothetical protein